MAATYAIRHCTPPTGRSGFLIGSRGRSDAALAFGWPNGVVRIFCRTREEAEAIRDACRREDWDGVDGMITRAAIAERKRDDEGALA